MHGLLVYLELLGNTLMLVWVIWTFHMIRNSNRHNYLARISIVLSSLPLMFLPFFSDSVSIFIFPLSFLYLTNPTVTQ